MRQIIFTPNANRADPRLTTEEAAKHAAKSLQKLPNIMSDINVRETEFSEMPVYANGEHLPLMIEFQAIPEGSTVTRKYSLLAARVVDKLRGREKGYTWHFDQRSTDIERVEARDQVEEPETPEAPKLPTETEVNSGPATLAEAAPVTHPAVKHPAKPAAKAKKSAR